VRNADFLREPPFIARRGSSGFQSRRHLRHSAQLVTDFCCTAGSPQLADTVAKVGKGSFRATVESTHVVD
jgi:hypothetical protein